MASSENPPPEANLLQVSITSHRRVLGPLIVGVKRVVHRLLTPILLKQVDLNSALLRSIHKQSLKLSSSAEDVAVLQGVVASLRDVAEGMKETIALQRTDLAELTMAAQSLQRNLQELKSREATRTNEIQKIRRHLTELTNATEARESTPAIELAEIRQHLRALTSTAESIQPARTAELDTVRRHLSDLTAAFERAREDIVALSARARRFEEVSDRALRDVRRIRIASDAAGPVVGLLPSLPAGASDIAAPGRAGHAVLDYFGFESRFRGSPEAIESRQRDYLSYFRGKGEVLDIGCGRGEFLSLLLAEQIPARGIDLDIDMVLLCQEKGLPVAQSEAADYLSSLPDRSLGGVFLSQVIEHLTTPEAVTLIGLVGEKLRIGGVFAIETMNPESYAVLSRWFWLDPTHVRLVHPETLQFLLEAAGFRIDTCEFRQFAPESDRIPRLDVEKISQHELEAFNAAIRRLNEIVYAPLDYFVIGIR
jgi:O-antigen chain-terminating methyltransferase